jgi:Bacterial protein of unknown function (DUF916)
MAVRSPVPARRRILQGMIGVLMMLFELGSGGVTVLHAATGGAHFSLSPSFLSPYNVKPRSYFIYSSNFGALITDKLHVTNDGNATGLVSLYPADATTQQNSGTMFLSRTDPRKDVGAWIKLSSQSLVLNPGQSVDVPFTVTIPTHVRPGQHGGGIVAETVSQAPPTSTSKAKGVSISVQALIVLGVLINLPGTTVEKLGISSVTYDDKSIFQRLLLGLTNSGTQLLYPSGYIQILNGSGQIVQNLPLKLRTFLPQTSIRYPVYIQHHQLPLGKRYTAKVSLRYGHDYSLNYSTTFTTFIQSPDHFVSLSQSIIVNPKSTIGALTVTDYIIGIVLLFLLGSACLFWGQKLYRTVLKRERRI